MYDYFIVSLLLFVALQREAAGHHPLAGERVEVYLHLCIGFLCKGFK